MKFYITAAIPYVNAAPHIGHAQEFVIADSIARYHRLIGDNTTLLTGADENSLKIVQASQQEKTTPLALCDKNAQIFQSLLESLNAKFDKFQRASARNHFLASKQLWQLCYRNGDIYKKSYQGLYCVGCETFYAEDELVNGLCPEHLKKPELVKESNYFFKLSRFQDRLLELINNNQLQIIPDFRKNEVVSFIKQGLEDFSISRSKKRAKGWGIPVPDDPNQYIYVWFDALNVYQSGIGFETNEEEYKKWWPADVHLIGKGITRFHAIYWPAILLSAGLKLPKTILVHGYITVNGQKMSKTIGNIVDPFTLINKYKADALRYYLLKEVPTFSDGDYSENRFKEIYNADLAGGLGNLIARVAKLAEKISLFFDEKIPDYKEILYNYPKYYQAIKDYRIHDALTEIWKEIKDLNQYIDQNKPWNLKEKPLENVLKHCSRKIREISKLIAPFLPKTAEIIDKQFTQSVKSSQSLFPRII